MELNFLSKLVNSNGISSNEERVRDLIEKEIKNYVDEIYIDKIGNLVAHKKGSKPTVMLAAHMDEVGLMIKKIQGNKVYFSAIGGVNAKKIIGSKVCIEGFKRECIVRKKGKIKKDKDKAKNLFIVLNKKELKQAKIGSYCNLVGNFQLRRNIISGKALDDRTGCYILIELAKKLKILKAKNEIYFVFTVQEEIGLYGARVSAYKINPDYAIAVDVTTYEKGTRELGKGPCITVKDERMIGNRCINGWLQEIADKNKIPLQLDVTDEGTTDASVISLTKEGIPATAIGPAVQDIHTTKSQAHQQDINNTIRLLELLLIKPPLKCVI